MIKKWIICLCAIAILCPLHSVYATNLKLAPNAGATVLMEATSKEILYDDHGKEKLYPASTTKIMTMILLFEAINNKKLKWDDILTCSAYASSMGGSQIYLEEGEQMSVADLFKAISIASANDACVMVGERIAGSHDNFVSMMNQKAKSLKLVNTHFVNPTGLHDENHSTCALDLATVAAYLIEIGGQRLLETTSLYDCYIRENTVQKFWLVNTNKLLKSYPGVDGLKTGYTKEAGYCMVATAKRDGLRLISVVMKESEPKVRNQEISQVLDYGFSLFESATLFQKGEVIEKREVLHSKQDEVNIIPLNDITYVIDKNKESQISYDIHYHSLVAPMKNGDVIGELVLKKDNEIIGRYPLTCLEDIESLSFLEKVMIELKNFI